jgi:hypothetical protein
MIVSIAAREFRSLMSGPLGWTVLAVVQLLLGYAFLVQVEEFLSNQGRFAAIPGAPGVTEAVVIPFAGNAGFLLLAVVSLVTMRLISEERRAQTLPLLLAAPVSPYQVVMGKYLGIIAFLSLMVGLLALMPASLLMGSDLDLGLAAAAFVGLLLLVAAFAAIGLYMSALASQPLVAAVSTWGVLLFLWILDWQGAAPQTGTQTLFAYMSLLAHYRSWLSGTVSSGDLLYFVLVCVLFVTLSARRVAALTSAPRPSAGKGWRRWLQGLRAVFPLMLLLAAFASLAWVSERNAVQFDWSVTGRGGLTAESTRLLGEIAGEVTITAFVADHSPLRRTVRELVGRYQALKPDITLAFRAPNDNPQQAREAKIGQEGELVLEWGPQRRVVRAVTEQAITNGLYGLLRSHDRWLVFLTGHAERDPVGKANHDLGVFGSQLETTGLHLHRINLAATAAIPDNTAALVVAGPQVDVLPGEVAVLQDYVQRGGNLLWLMDPGSLRGLQPLADQLGVQVIAGTVVDPTTSRINLDNPAMALAAGYGAHAALAGFKLVTVFPYAVALESVPMDGWQVEPLVLTAPNSWAERDPLEREVSFDAGKEPQGPLKLGLALNRLTADGRQQRVIVLGDGDFISNAFIGNGGNLEFGQRLLTWLVGDDTLLAVVPITVQDATLTLSSKQLGIIGFGFMLVLPSSLLLTGLLLGWLRNRR